MSDCKTRAAQSGLSLSRSTDHGQSLAETRKSLKAEIDVLQDKLNEAAKIFRSGKSDPVPVKCDVIQDWNTDELVWVSAELLLKAENLRGNIHLMGRPGARSVMLSAEKQVLYENMDDCVNGAVTGLNIAVYNLRSACRIGSRTDFCKW